MDNAPFPRLWQNNYPAVRRNPLSRFDEQRFHPPRCGKPGYYIGGEVSRRADPPPRDRCSVIGQSDILMGYRLDRITYVVPSKSLRVSSKTYRGRHVHELNESASLSPYCLDYHKYCEIPNVDFCTRRL